MPEARLPYLSEFRRQIVDLKRTGLIRLILPVSSNRPRS